MKRNKYGEINPVVDKTKCTNCGLCSNFCTFSRDTLKKEVDKVSAAANPQTFGLEDAFYCVAWNPDTEQRIKCCSGGATTKLASYLMEQGKIDGMIHSERLWGKKGDLHYGVRLSKNIEEIKENVSSTYQALDFSDVLAQLEENKTYFLTGTPCVIRGMKKLFNEHKKFKNINLITCALICSHNTNSVYIDYLMDLNKIKTDDEFKVNIRNKDDISDANNFKNHIYTRNEDLLKKNRFETGWTKIWREYYFALGSCLKCSDFWGYEADISIKDAWGEWSDDPKGKSIAVIRNPELKEDFINSGLIFEELNYDKLKDHQSSTPIYKQTSAKNKFYKSILSKSNRKNGLLGYTIVSKSSKFLYKNFGFKITRTGMKLIDWIAKRAQKL